MSIIISTDENRDINIHHIDDDIKRQRIQYNGDQIYPNVSHNLKPDIETGNQVFSFEDMVNEVVCQRWTQATAATHLRSDRQPSHLDINTPA